jgi:hypothetical protein
MTVRPSQSMYNLLVQKLQQAEDERAAAVLTQLYEITEIPGFEPKTIWEEEFGPKNNASKLPWGPKLERALANAEAKIAVLSAGIESWSEAEQAWLDEQPKVDVASLPAKSVEHG